MASGISGKGVPFVQVPSTMERYLLVHSQWPGQYMSNELPAVLGLLYC